MKSFLFHILPALLFFLALSSSYAQKKKIRIQHADRLSFIKKDNQEMRMLVGNVELKQKALTMFCDSAHFYTDKNSVDAFGNVHIEKGDSVDIYSDSLKYNGNTKQAVFYRNVRLDHNQLTIHTDLLEYNVKTGQASYFNHGKVINKQTTLTSKRGYYFTETKMSYFQDSVRLRDPEYHLQSDTLGFNIKTRMAYFYDTTHIELTDGTVDCRSGRYDTENNIGWFGHETVLNQPPQKLFCDSLYLNQDSGYARVYKPFRWVDTSMNSILTGKHARFFQDNNFMLAYDSLLLTNIMDGDSLHISADTFRSYNDTISDNREFFAYYDVRIFKSDLQGRSDSLFFSYQDSVIRMYHDPVLWNENNQMIGDTINISLEKNQLDSVYLLNNARIISREEQRVFNQIRGNNIYGAFRGDQLGNMYVSRNSKSIYFGKDDDNAYIGVNEATCTNMRILFKDNHVDQIKFFEKPEAQFTPIQQTSPASHRIEKFQWLDGKRPKSKQDLLAPTDDQTLRNEGN